MTSHLRETRSYRRQSRQEKPKSPTVGKSNKTKTIKTKVVKPELGPTQNCLHCSRFRKCDKQKKSWKYICSKFKAFSEQLPKLDIIKLPKHRPSEEITERIEFQRMIDQSIDQERSSPLPNDLRIDDRDLPLAKNFFEFTTSPKFLNIKPFAKQLETGLHLFAEFCVAEGSYVHTERGLLRIEDIQNKSGLLATKIKVATRNGNHYTSHAGMTGKRKRCIKINAADHELTTTPAHQYLVLDKSGKLDWMKTKDITPGDYLATPIGMNIWPEMAPSLSDNKQVTAELARFIGYTLTDGYFTERRSNYIDQRGNSKNYLHFGFISSDLQLINDYRNCVAKICGFMPTMNSYRPQGIYETIYESRFCNLQLGNWLIDNGFNPGNCYDKEIPDFILQSPRKLVIEFIRACFDCDGWVQSARIGIKLNNRAIINLLDLLLQNLGIYGYKKYGISKIDYKIKRSKNDLKNYTALWECHDEYAKLFANIIGTNNSARQEIITHNLNIIIPARNHTQATNNVKPGDIVNIKGLYNRLKTSYERKNYHDSKFTKAFYWLARTNSTCLDWLSEDEINQFSPAIADEIKIFKKHNYAYRRVNKIKDAGYHTVYDLTVPKTESFLANGIIVHNCPRCSDKKYAFNIPKKASYERIFEHLQLLEYGVCPNCGARKSELYREQEMKVPVELAGLMGQRSGKSSGSVMLGVYSIHRFLKLANASKAFGLLDSDDLQGTLVAQTWEKAKERLYNPMYNYLTDKPWFKQYNSLLDHYGNKHGEKLYNIKDVFASYRVRKLLIRPMGPDKRKLRGDTSFLAILDELGWFDVSEGSEKKIKQNASEIYTSMRNTFRTLRSAYYRLLKRGYDNMPPPIFPNISSPSSKRDQMVKNYERSKTSRYIFGQHYSTWEYNPTLNIRDFDDDFAADEAKAWRDFGAVPPNSSSPFIPGLDDLIGIINKRLSNTVRVYQRIVTSANQREMRSGKIRFTTVDQNKRVAAIDAGYNANSFALVAGFKDEETNRPVIDTFVEIQPTTENPINHNAIYEDVIVPIVEHLNVKLLVSDRWQNLKLLHDAEAQLGIAIEQYSVKYGDFEAVRQDVWENLITIPRPEIPRKKVEVAGGGDYPGAFAVAPVAHLLYQFITVRDTIKSVEKGDGVTDDLFRALVLCHSFITDDEYAEYCMGKINEGHNNNPFLGVVASRGGGGATSGNGVNGGVVTGSSGPIGLVSSFGINR